MYSKAKNFTHGLNYLVQKNEKKKAQNGQVPRVSNQFLLGSTDSDSVLGSTECEHLSSNKHKTSKGLITTQPLLPPLLTGQQSYLNDPK